jgi:hypothetical protein
MAGEDNLEIIKHTALTQGEIDAARSLNEGTQISYIGVAAATLAERGSKYGAFRDQAQIVQELKGVMARSPNWRIGKLTPPMREALEMIQHKVARILNGDPSYKDSWHDICGYAKLVEDLCDE